ncbi:MAG TPA: VWA domain-containing protein [Thermoanaerobaculia bacterium]
MSPFIRNTTAALLAAALAVPVAAQQKHPEGEPPRLVENIDIRIINVDVVVTDKKGNAVTGLKKDDFEIYENNAPKMITNFFEVEGRQAKNAVIDPVATAAAPPAEAAKTEELPENLRRRIIFYVDNLSLHPFNRNRVFQQMKDFIKEVMRPGDEAMIATFNRSMKVRVPFTKDLTQLNQTLEAMAGESGLGVGVQAERKQTEDRIREARGYDEAIAAARSYASSVEHDLRQSVQSINGLMSTLAGLEGKKILVLTSEGFPMQPGREVFYYIDEISRERRWSNTGTMLEGMSYDGSQLIQSVAKTANANNITLYTVHAAGLSQTNDMSAENARPASPTVSWAASQNTTESMQVMAQLTGGLASINTNNFALAFNRIQRDLDSYYSLGYRAGTERVDRQRYLEVKIKNARQRGLTVRSRQTFVEKSTYAEMSDRVVANLLYKTKANDLKILVRTGRPRAAEDGYFTVPVEVQIPMDEMTLLPQGDTDFIGGFDVYVAVANKESDMSDVQRKAHTVRVPAADKEKAKGKYYTYSVELLMERGLNRISIGVVDHISNVTGFAREQVIAQDLR